MKQFWPEFKNVPKHDLGLNFYSLVEVPVDKDQQPIKLDDNYLAFTNRSKARKIKIDYVDFKTFMLGDLTRELASSSKLQFIRINPFNIGEIVDQEEVTVVPIFDKLTQKYLISPAEEALSLLAIDNADEKRFGIKFVFYSITNKFLPETYPEREKVLQEKIQELAHIIPRVPIERGSGSFICILLNLGNVMEETAFIRNYETMDPYSDILFVNSNFKILTGNLSPIVYDGSTIDTIFRPMISWQQSNRKEELLRNYSFAH